MAELCRTLQNMVEHGSTWYKMAELEHWATWQNIAEHDGTWRYMAEHGGRWRNMTEHVGTWRKMAPPPPVMRGVSHVTCHILYTFLFQKM